MTEKFFIIGISFILFGLLMILAKQEGINENIKEIIVFVVIFAGCLGISDTLVKLVKLLFKI